MGFDLKFTYVTDALPLPTPFTSHRVLQSVKLIEEMQENEVHAFVRHWLPPDQQIIAPAPAPPSLPNLTAKEPK